MGKMLKVQGDGMLGLSYRKWDVSRGVLFLSLFIKIALTYSTQKSAPAPGRIFEGKFEVSSLTTNSKGFESTWQKEGYKFLETCSFRYIWNLSLILCLDFQSQRSDTAPHTTKMTTLRNSTQFRTFNPNLACYCWYWTVSQLPGMRGLHLKEISSANFSKSNFLEIWSWAPLLFCWLVTLFWDVYVVDREA